MTLPTFLCIPQTASEHWIGIAPGPHHTPHHLSLFESASPHTPDKKARPTPDSFSRVGMQEKEAKQASSDSKVWGEWVCSFLVFVFFPSLFFSPCFSFIFFLFFLDHGKGTLPRAAKEPQDRLGRWCRQCSGALLSLDCLFLSLFFMLVVLVSPQKKIHRGALRGRVPMKRRRTAWL